jgi:hypothetical protein
MKWFNALEDRFLMLVLTVTLLSAYLFTQDALFADLLKYSVGATFGVLVARANKQLVITQDTESAKSVVQKFIEDK